MPTLPKRVLYYGRNEPLPKQHQLYAGPLSLIYEGGDLRYIKLGDQEVLRRIYVAIRDHNWNTVLPVISNEQIEASGDSFHITYDVENKENDLDFFWKGTISGDARGTITFSMDGEARSTFRRNRMGFCVLHPMACAGYPCRIEHIDGTVDEKDFPVQIGPQLIIDGTVKPVSPFDEMRRMSYPIHSGLQAEIGFTGDIFEMEDQRNWTDASYKSYSTPLRLPFPVEVEKGAKIGQVITLTLAGDVPEAQSDTTDTGLTFSVNSSSAGPLPRLGLGVASHGQPLSNTELTRLEALNLSHLRLDLRLFEPGYEENLRRTTIEANALGVSLEVAIILSDAAEDELKKLTSLLAEVRPPVWAWLIFHSAEATTGEAWVKLAREHLAGYDPAAKIGAGTNVYFTDLNRGRPPVHVLDLVSYSLNPQVHAFDNASLIETLEAQATTVDSARHFCSDVPIIVSPITLKPRFNPNATGPEPEPGPGELPSQVDERQMSLFGAGWTAGSLKYLTGSDVHSLTYYETSGWRGVMEVEGGSILPEKFQSVPGAVFPLYHVLADVGEFAGGEVIPSTSSNSLQVDGLAVRKDGKTRVILANLSAEAQQVTVRNLGRQVQIRQLDESNVEAAMQAPEEFRVEQGDLQQTSDGALQLDLLPYAIVRIDS
jgi:hypothetical protein